MPVKLIAITEYLGGEGSPEELVEYAGRVCYNSSPDGDPCRFIRQRIKAGHESIVEHASATFDITDISRACGNQIVRSRLASYSQVSMRYTEPEDKAIYPEEICENDWAFKVYDEAIENARRAYATLRDMGIKKEDARFILPLSTATRIVMTMNFRELRHFLRLRLDKAAQWEIREVAEEILGIMMVRAPSVFVDIAEEFGLQQKEEN